MNADTSRRLILGACLLPALAGAALAQTPPRPEAGRITILGTGEVRQAPDLATISLGVVSQGRVAAEALAANTRAMAEAVASLKQAGIEDRDLQTSQFSVQPQYQQDPGGRAPPRIVGYQVSNRLSVRVRDLTKLGGVLDRAVNLGANTVHGPVFGFSNTAALLDAARKAAVEDALRRARIQVEALGVRLGRVMLVEEQGAAIPRPVPMAMARAAVAEAAPAPIEAGESVLNAMVSVTWEIAQ